jgi:hypothetical protein
MVGHQAGERAAVAHQIGRAGVLLSLLWVLLSPVRAFRALPAAAAQPQRGET